MSKVLITTKKSKTAKDMHTTLNQMEKIIDDKLANQKTFTPVLFAVVTSIIAFLFVYDLGDDIAVVQMYFLVFVYALLCFAVLIISLFGRSDYNAKVKETTMDFQPHKLSSYCYLSDEDYLCSLVKYAGRRLTHDETLAANCIKQKINEYAFKNDRINVALSIVLTGVVLLGVICMIGVFILPTLPRYCGGTT